MLSYVDVPPRKQQSDLQHDQFHAEYRRQHWDRVAQPPSSRGRRSSGNTIFAAHMNERQPDVPQDDGRHDRHASHSRVSARRMRSRQAYGRDRAYCCSSRQPHLAYKDVVSVLAILVALPHSAGFHHETSERSRRCRAPRCTSLHHSNPVAIQALCSAATKLFVRISDA